MTDSGFETSNTGLSFGSNFEKFEDIEILRFLGGRRLPRRLMLSVCKMTKRATKPTAKKCRPSHLLVVELGHAPSNCHLVENAAYDFVCVFLPFCDYGVVLRVVAKAVSRLLLWSFS